MGVGDYGMLALLFAGFVLLPKYLVSRVEAAAII
jgi:hypothetical protein